ncbi:UNVERIFIED_CONTAM: FCS-Like Zinc finger 10 [Sesamum radiatum]|uniref:FCS-Like Zinc finger 10 n=1 Tax=Sesamum radiatum TaxID=300843 RepID=A0AAW2MG23_SESRA
MLRKRTRSHQKDQHMNNLMPDAISESYFHSDILSQKHKTNSFLKVSGLFVGFNPRSSESDSVRSPTSPLDFRIFSSFGNPFRCQRSQNEGHHKSWDCKVGLSIIDSLDNEAKQVGKVPGSSDNKNILCGRQMSIRRPNFCSHVDSLETPNSLPKDVAVFPNARPELANVHKGNSDAVFEIGQAAVEPEPYQNFRACSLDSERYGSHLTKFGNRKSRFGSGSWVPENTMNQMPWESAFLGGNLELGSSSGEKLSTIPPSIHPGTCLVDSIPASEIELSEDYTCVRTHGPNPKVTHIFCDRILECHNDEVTEFLKKSENDNANPEADEPADNLGWYHTPEADKPADVLGLYPPKFCYSCQKKLDGEDIYMYRGEKPFCSYSCRSQEIEIDEEMEKIHKASSEISDSSQEISESGLFITT